MQLTQKQDLNQVTSALPAISRAKVYDELARRGKLAGDAARDTREEIAALAEAGNISAEEGIGAILQVAKDFPGAAGGMARAANSLNGIISTLKDTFNLVAFAALEPLIKLFTGSVGAFINSGNALDDLREKASLFGREATFAIQDFITLFGADFRKIFESAKSIFNSLVDLIPGLIANLKGVVGIVADLASAFARGLEVARPFIKGIELLSAALLNFRPAILLIEGLVARFLVLKALNSTLFTGLIDGLALLGQGILRVIGQFTGLTTATNTAAAATKAVDAATGSLANRLSSGLAGAIGVAVIAWQAYNLIVDDAKKKTDDAFKAATQGLNISPSAGIQAIKDQDEQLKESIRLRDEARKKDKELNDGFLNDLRNTGDLARGVRGFQAEQARKEAEKNTREIEQDARVRKAILEGVARETGASVEQILAEAAKQNLNIFDVDPASQQRFIDKLVDGLKKGKTEGEKGGKDIGDAIGTGINDGVNSSLEDMAAKIQQKINDALSSIEGLIGAQAALNAATQRVKDINTEINAKIAERNKLQNNTFLREDEIADALDRQRQILRDLAAIDIARRDNAIDEQTRAREFAEFMADFPDREKKAQLDLRRAVLERQRAEEDLNDILKDRLGVEAPEINLAGRSLDEARTLIRNATSSLKAQEKSAAITEDQRDKQRQIEDAQLRVEDSILNEESARDSIRDLAEEKSAAEEADLRAKRDYLIELENQRIAEASLNRDKIEAQQFLDALRKGEVGVLKTIADINAEIKRLQDEKKRATQEQAVAQANVNKLVALESDNQNAIKNAILAYVQAKRDQLGIEGQISGALDRNVQKIKDAFAEQQKLNDESSKPITQDKTINVKTEGNLSPVITPVFKLPIDQMKDDVTNAINDSIVGAGAGTLGLPTGTGGLLSGSTGDLLAAAGSALVQAAQGVKAIASAVTVIGRRTNVAIPTLAFASGGVLEANGGHYIKGASGPQGKMLNVRVGEHSRPEAILPIGHQASLQRLLATDSRVLNPILAVLPKIKLPSTYIESVVARAQQSALGTQLVPVGSPTVVASPQVNIERGPTVQQRQQNKQERKAELDYLADRISDGIAKKVEQGGGDFHLTQNISTPVQSPDLIARKAAREAERAWRDRNQ